MSRTENTVFDNKQSTDVRRLLATIFNQIGHINVAFAAKRRISACVPDSPAIK